MQSSFYDSHRQVIYPITVQVVNVCNRCGRTITTWQCGTVFVELLISTTESTEPSEVVANASKPDREWKRSEHVTSYNMKKRRCRIPVFTDQFFNRCKLKTCFNPDAWLRLVFYESIAVEHSILTWMYLRIRIDFNIDRRQNCVRWLKFQNLEKN